MVSKDLRGPSVMGCFEHFSESRLLELLEKSDAFRCPFSGDKCVFLFVLITFVGALYSVSVCLH